MTAPHEAGRADPGGKLAPDHVSLACCVPSRLGADRERAETREDPSCIQRGRLRPSRFR
jgi:hypothetical protein